MEIGKEDECAPINAALVRGSRKLYIFFGGIVGGLGMPPFEFFESSGVLGYSRLFLRDLSQSWYQRGLPGLGSDIESVSEFLSLCISQSGAKEVVFVGNSMGGYAALMFCSLLRQGRVVAFSPQTMIDEKSRKLLGDDRWAAQLRSIDQAPPVSPILNLPLHLRRTASQICADVHFSSSDPLDALHARALAGLPNVRLREYARGGHRLVAELRDQGKLVDALS